MQSGGYVTGGLPVFYGQQPATLGLKLSTLFFFAVKRAARLSSVLK